MSERPWTPARFRAFAAVAFGAALDPVSDLAESLSVPLWAARGWASGENPIPTGQSRRFAEFYRGATRQIAHFRREAWLYAFSPLDEAGESQKYVVHLDDPPTVTGIPEDGSPAPGPPGEWLLAHGDDPDEEGGYRRYLIHFPEPQFVCRVVTCGLEGEAFAWEGEVDDETGIRWRAEGDILFCEFQWIDPAPEPEALLELLQAGGDMLMDDAARTARR